MNHAIAADLDSARRAALQLIDYYGITHPSEINLEDMAWGLGIDVSESDIKRSEAQLLRKGKAGVIRIRYGEKEMPRGRFSIGHELGHWKLHPDQNQFWICTADQIHRYSGNWMELEANTFSSELLMPTPLFKPLCQKGTFGFYLADRLSEMFRTSLQATALRMVDETPEPAIVVLSNGHTVCWSKRNMRKLPDFEFQVPRGMRLHGESLAWGATIDGDRSSQVQAGAWFPNLRESWRYEVFEDMRYIEPYDLALSLIVVHEE